ncbi:hypothetical protein [Aquimarina sp. MMG016]|uniref:tetratricopeptide repeat protein n=1 Tax=Aquimarina sp. MMG016 TaxID=2822690 RepID=UPI001B39F319|nr:hypothetical protein [Aquimarina sp. MMG016]MBQ4819725.1 hypothetical protein [Aquimarina sp. MMG016]
MKRSQQIFDTIEQYLANALSEEDKKTFENQLSQDAELQLEVKKHQELQNVLSDSKRLDFKKELRSIQEEIYEEERIKRRHRFSYMKIAATILILIGIGSIWFVNNKTKNEFVALYASYYSPYPASSEYRSDTSVDQKGLIRKYASGEYASVITDFEALDTALVTDELRLYIGNSYLQNDQEEKAIEIFRTINEESSVYEDSLWYTALSHLKKENTNHTIVFLDKVIEYNGRYKPKAVELKNELLDQ